MFAAVAHVAQGQGGVDARLPLDVEGIVDGVRQNIGPVIGAEVQGVGAVRIAFLIVDRAAPLSIFLTCILRQGTRHAVKSSPQRCRDHTWVRPWRGKKRRAKRILKGRAVTDDVACKR